MEIGLLIIFLTAVLARGKRIDENGYITFCPCMGRFGNQADHFLGTLAFSKALNRTLVLPPWVEYKYQEPRSIQVPFKTYFTVEALQEYHRVITMDEFMEKIAPDIWPPEKRVSFCYMARGDSDDCNAKEGNPFGPFWDTFKIDFVASEFYGPLTYDTHHDDMAVRWNENYPPQKWPVLAFVGAPASFPIQVENRHLQKYLVWSSGIERSAKEFIKNTLPKGAFVAIHLRNGPDWVRACEHVKHSPNLMASPQCLGYNNEHGKVTEELCLPSEGSILKKVKSAVKTAKAKSIFVSSDHNHMIPELTKALARMEVSVHRHLPSDPHLDLAISGLSNYFVGNCVSSFTAFVKRERDSHGLPSSFFSFPMQKTSSRTKHDEF